MSEGGADDGDAAGAPAADLEREHAGLLVANVRASNLPTLLVGALLAAFYTHYGGVTAVWYWLAALAAVLAWRWWLLRAAEQAPRGPAFPAAMAATGLVWAAAPVVVAAALGAALAFTAVLLAAGIAVAAFASYGVDRRVTLLVTLPILLAVIAVCALSGEPAFYTVGAALPLLYVQQYFVAERARRELNKQIRLRLENAVLVEQISAHADKTSAELDRRMETERMLRASRDRAERLSATDGLTEIANRRYFDKRLKSEISRAFRDRTSLSLVICDIDYFKQYNDSYGHQQGDECLKAFAGVLESHCRRGGDLAARIGGEEFALVLPNTDHDAALKLAEHARAAFDALAVPHEASAAADHVTASFGVASVMPDSLDAGEALLGAADQALYAAKDAGRNRVLSERDVGRDAAAAR
ncbi:MAG: diguanylate cyclase domain-containing protein [Gammaproteobacteria bacterium]